MKGILFASVVTVVLALAVADGPPGKGATPSDHHPGGGTGEGGEAGARAGVGFGALAGFGTPMGAGVSGNGGGKASAFASQGGGTGEEHRG